MAPSRHPLLAGTRFLLPVAIALAVLGAVVAHDTAARIVAGFFALIGLAAFFWQQRHRPTLLLDDDGYAIEQLGREKLRVKWSEVQKVRVDRRAPAVYVDTGDKARNLFVPPRTGYGFQFADGKTACARIIAAVGMERVVEVERIDVS
jgi:hypothetical protein